MPRQTTTDRASKSLRTSTSKGSKIRADIQGLRAIAVLAVVANHLLEFPGGGFVGVDVFFVISGFVITSGLVREHQKSGTISFKEFYKRRARRILPAGVLTIAVTVAASYLVFFSNRANGVLTDGLWALLFAGNWRFAIDGTDYWARGTTSPLQHYWSLGVEEQFYFVWPIVVAVVLGLAIRFHMTAGRRLMALGAVLGFFVATSFVWALFDTSQNATWAYFSTFSRAWELGIGALLAVAAPLLMRIPDGVRPFLAWFGLAGIVLSLFVISKASTFPAPWAALPVVATALVILAGTGGEVKFLQPITNRVMTYIGDASYSLYLWHFPAIVLIEAVWPDKDAIYYVVALTCMAFFTAVSRELVEKPVLASGWLSSKKAPEGGRTRATSSGGPSDVRSRLPHLGLGAAVMACVVLVPLALMQDQKVAPSESVAIAAPVAPGPLAKTGPSSGPAQAGLTAEIEAAVQASSWPQTTPALDVVSEEGKPLEDKAGCGRTDFSVAASCLFNPGKEKTAVVLGDSTGITLLPTVRAALGDTYSVRGMTMAACIVLDVQTDRPADVQANCEQHKRDALEEITALKPEYVFVSNSTGPVDSANSGSSITVSSDEWKTGVEDLATKLQPSGAKVVFVGSAPIGPKFPKCATRTSTPSDCATLLSNGYVQASQATAAGAEAAGAFSLDTRSWFCNGDNVCPSLVGTTLVKRDGIHTTRQYAEQLAPVFYEQLMTLVAS